MSNDAIEGSQGILVASDKQQEWLLPWWWGHYSRCNNYPVAIVDLGMTEEAKAWCQEHGTLLALPRTRCLKKEETPSEKALQWEKCFGTTFWPSRSSWFIKPLAMMQTSYHKTLWLDLDTEVRASLEPLFQEEHELAMAQEPEFSKNHEISHGLIHENEKLFNAGVVLYKAKSAAMALWAQEALKNAPYFWSDQHVAARLHYQNRLTIQELSPLYNWRFTQGENPEAIIVHYVGNMGKEYISLRLHSRL